MNAPGLPALAYRIGTHATFFETMKARLSSADYSELADLKTRRGDDPAIALMDAWALVADVLTFYQERIANEGYLRTATERRSVLEIARLIGYELRPGVAATAYLAYTLDEDRSKAPTVPSYSPIAAGSRAQSMPGPGELPQSFETSEALEASSGWNNLQVRLTRPQTINCKTTPETIYFEGLSTNLRPNDPLLIVCGPGEGEQQLCWVEDVITQAAENRTEVTLQRSRKDARSDTFQAFLKASIDEATGSFHGTTAEKVIEILTRLQEKLGSASGDAVPGILLKFRASWDEMLRLATRRRLKDLTPWIREVQEELDSLAEGLPPPKTIKPSASTEVKPLTALQTLGTILEPLAKAPSEHPASEAALARDNQQTFAPTADTVPQLMTALRPELAPMLYQAWESLGQPPLQPGVYAFRVKTAPFGSTAAAKPVFDDTGKIDGNEEWPIAGTEVISVKLSAFGIRPNLMSAIAGAGFRLLAEVSFKNGIDTYGTKFLLDGNAVDETVPGGKLEIQIPRITPTVGVALPPPKLAMTLTHSGQKDVITVEIVPTLTALKVSLNKELLDQVIGLDKSLRFPVGERTVAISLLEDHLDRLNGTVARQTVFTLTIQIQSPLKPNRPNVLALDTTYDQIVPDSWVVIQRPGQVDPIVTLAKSVETVAQFNYNLTPKVTELTLGEPWLLETDRLLSVMRHTTVLAQSEKLTLAEEPVDDDIQGDRIPLDGLYAGLQPGRWVIVCGERTDIGGVTGVRACELQMLASVEQSNEADAPHNHSTLVLARPLAYSYAAESVKIYGNVVKATHGESRRETLGSGDGSQATQQFTLRQPPLTFVAAPNPSGVESTLKLYVNDVEWHEADSLAGLELADRKFITRTDDEGKTRIVFGNGEQGARLPTGRENIRAAYRNGIGKGGNVQPEQISQLGARPHWVSGVTNPLRASGGAAKESRDQARQNAPLAVMALDRLVSTQDYADFARTFAGIGKASAVRLSDGRRQLVHVTIAGADDIPIDKNSDVYRNLGKALRDFGDPSLPIQVDVRELLALVIGAKVRVWPDYLWEAVKPQVVATLLDKFSFQRRELGQTVFLSEVISVIQRVTGVASVDVDLLHSISESELVSAKPEDLLSKLTTLAEASQPDASVRIRLAETVAQAGSSRPGATGTNGIFPAQLAFLTPGVMATIILNEAPL